MEKASGIRCPDCGMNSSSVIESKPSFDGIRRRRVCDACGFRFSTFENVDGFQKRPIASKEREKKIIELAKTGKKISEIALDVGLSRVRVYQIVNAKLDIIYVDKTEDHHGTH